MALVSQREKNPPAASRSYGFVAVAMHDAAVAAYHWIYLYPEVPQARFDQDADDAARLRVVAGTSYPSDADAGLKLGRSIVIWCEPVQIAYTAATLTR